MDLKVHNLSMGLARAFLIESKAGLVLVDAGSSHREQCVIKLMRTLGRADLRLIFITHAHLDHYGSAAALHRITDAPIAIHPADADAMARGETNLGKVRHRGRLVKPLLPFLQPFLKPEPTPAHLYFEDGEDLPLSGLEAKVIHTPGHTPGSCCLLIDGRIAFAGDLVSTNGGIHVQRYYAEDWSLIPGSLARLQSLKPDIVYPAHGRHPINQPTLLSMQFEKA